MNFFHECLLCFGSLEFFGLFFSYYTNWISLPFYIWFDKNFHSKWELLEIHLTRKLIKQGNDNQILSNNQSMIFNLFLIFLLPLGEYYIFGLVTLFLLIHRKWNFLFVIIIYKLIQGIFMILLISPLYKIAESNFQYLSIQNINRDAFLFVIAFKSFLPSIRNYQRAEFNIYYFYTIMNKIGLLLATRAILNENFNFNFGLMAISNLFWTPILIYPYNFFHRYAHTQNTLWSFHKPHHFSKNIDQGDNGSITMVDLISNFQMLMPHYPTLFIFQFTLVLIFDTHQYDNLGLHDVHHLFHSKNLSIPSSLVSSIPSFSFDYSIPPEKKAGLFEKVAPALQFYSSSDNDLAVLNEKIKPFLEHMTPFKCKSKEN